MVTEFLIVIIRQKMTIKTRVSKMRISSHNPTSTTPPMVQPAQLPSRTLCRFHLTFSQAMVILKLILSESLDIPNKGLYKGIHNIQKICYDIKKLHIPMLKNFTQDGLCCDRLNPTSFS